MLHCTNCGAENIDSARFCGSCGTTLQTSGPASGGWRVVIQAGPGAGQTYSLGTSSRMGRSPDNEIQLLDGNASRTHALIQRQDNQGQAAYFVQDQNSTNGTFLNGVLLSQPTYINPGDQIQIGDVVLQVQGPDGQPAVPPAAAPAFTAPSPAVQPYAPTQSPAQAPAPAPAAQSNQGSCLRNCLIFSLISLCLLITIGGAGYYMVSTGRLDRRTVQNAIGAGSGEINVANLTDESITLLLTRLDGTPEEQGIISEESYGSFEIGGYGGIIPGRYEVALFTGSGLPQGSCDLEFKSGTALQVVAVPEGIAISLDGVEAQSVDDLDILTSSWCRR
jgi:hypothetical protein